MMRRGWNVAEIGAAAVKRLAQQAAPAVALSAAVAVALLRWWPGRRVIYSSKRHAASARDFRGWGEPLWEVGRPMTGESGAGSWSFSNGVLTIQRANAVGRFSVELETYHVGGTKCPHLPARAGARSIRVTGEARASRGNQVLRLALTKANDSRAVLIEAHISLTGHSPDWTAFDEALTVPPTEACKLRIDHQHTSEISEVHIRQLKITDES